MPLDYHLDLYPADDPRDGARIVRYTTAEHLQEADYRDVVGVGTGKAVLSAGHPDAALLDPEGEQYLRIVRDDGSTELVVGGLFIDRVEYEAAVAAEARRLEFGGAGTMAYLARAVMAPHTYLDVAIGQDPFDQIWRLYAQGPIAGGDHLGAVLWRVVYEAQHFRSGTSTYTHKHADGVTYTDNHPNDRRRSAIPAVVLGFDAFEDSDGNPWTIPSGSFTARVGENLLAVVRRLMEAGLYIELDPDTFELRAWEGTDHRRDRTGGAWGADVVRLQAPTDGTIATGSIKSDATRLINSHVRRTTIWAGGAGDAYGLADTSSGIPWEGFVPSDAEDTAALDAIADAQLDAREEAGDVLTARLKVGDEPTAGRYLPFEHVKLDDLVTVHTGTSEWDYNEATYPVAALRLHLRPAGDWDAWVDLGASYEAMAERRFDVGVAGAHSHPPNPQLCQRAELVAPTFVDSAANSEGEGGVGSMTVPSGLTDAALFIAVGDILGQTFPPPSVSWNGEAATLIDEIEHGGQGGIALYVILDPSPGTAHFDSSNGNGVLGGWLFENVDQAAPIAGSAFATGTSATAAASMANLAGTMAIAAMAVDDDDFVSDAVAGPTAAVGMTSDWSAATQAGFPGFRDMEYAGGHGDWSPSWTLDESHPWAAFVAAVAGSGGTTGDSGPMPVGANDEADHGTSVRAARCDHVHPHSDLSDHDDETHHAIGSIDGLEAALAAAGVTDHGGLTGLADDDHPQYQTEAEVDAQIAAAVATIEASDLATRWTPVTTWNGDHWIIVTDGSGTPVLTEVS